MIFAACWTDVPIITVLGPLRIWPPAELTSELNHTARPSCWRP